MVSELIASGPSRWAPPHGVPISSSGASFEASGARFAASRAGSQLAAVGQNTQRSIGAALTVVSGALAPGISYMMLHIC